MAEAPSFPLTPAQVSALERLLRAGFKFVTFERFARYLAVEKQGFVALLDPAEGRLRIVSQVGYRLGEEIGMLVERAEGKWFVWKGESIVASPDLLTAYARFKAELSELLSGLTEYSDSPLL
jgi:hypothetical protein